MNADEDQTRKFEQARRKSQQNLGGRLEALRAGRMPQALEPFAKAYLGLFLEIDEALSPEQRVRQVAGAAVAEAVLEGLVAVAEAGAAPAPEQIGRDLARNALQPYGYVLLAGLARRTQISAEAALLDLPGATLRAGLCYRYANTPNQPAGWARYLVAQRPQMAAETFLAFWRPLLAVTDDNLPGLYHMLHQPEWTPLVRRVLLPLLAAWPGCKAPLLRDLLHAALRLVDSEALLERARAVLAADGELEVKKRIYWLCTAYLLSPADFAQALADYAGRRREKTLPLLDFVVQVLDDADPGFRFEPRWLAHLLRIIAPTFRRNEPLTGGLDATSGRVLWLFERLGQDASPEAVAAVNELRKIRVMRIYRDVLSQMAEAQRRAAGA
ncbi:MAG: hypothetical protein P8076_14990 [Gammaproteobacteria bacterium]